jgi:hypothetical protein
MLIYSIVYRLSAGYAIQGKDVKICLTESVIGLNAEEFKILIKLDKQGAVLSDDNEQIHRLRLILS